MGNRPFQSPPIIATASGTHFCLSRVPLQEWIKAVNSFRNSYVNVTRATTEQLTELLSGAGITGEACDVLFRAFKMVPSEASDTEAVKDVDVDEFVCAAVLLASGPFEEKVAFLVSQKDAQKLGWVNSISVFLLLVASARGVQRLAELWSAPPVAIRDFVTANEPQNGHWTASELLQALRRDPYSAQYLENLEKPHSMDDVRHDQQQGWKRYEKSLVRLRRQWAIRSRTKGNISDDPTGTSEDAVAGRADLNPSLRRQSTDGMFGAMGMLSMGLGTGSSGTDSSKLGLEQPKLQDGGEELQYDDVRSIMMDVAPSLDCEALIEAYFQAEKTCQELGIPFQSVGSSVSLGKTSYYRPIRRTDLMPMLEVAIAFVALDRPGHNVLSSASYVHLSTLLHEKSEFFEHLPKALDELVPPLEVGAPLRFRNWMVSAGAWCITEIRKQCAEELQKVFMKYDLDNSGQIDRSEFEAIVRELMEQIIFPTDEQREACDQIAQGIADEILEKADLDESGHVDYAEFWNCVKHIMNKQGELVHALKTASTLEQVGNKFGGVQDKNDPRRGSKRVGSLQQTNGSSRMSLGGSSKTKTRFLTNDSSSEQPQPTDQVESHNDASLPPTRPQNSPAASLWAPEVQHPHAASSSNEHSDDRTVPRAGSKDSRRSVHSRLSARLSRKGSKERASTVENPEVVPISPAGKRGSLLGSVLARK